MGTRKRAKRSQGIAVAVSSSVKAKQLPIFYSRHKCKRMLDEESIQTIAGHLQLRLTENDFAANKKKLVEKVNELIQSDFQKLISILYRLDVSEEKLRRLLKKHSDTDAGIIVTDLILERQAQKIQSRRQFRKSEDEIDDDEKW